MGKKWVEDLIVCIGIANIDWRCFARGLNLSIYAVRLTVKHQLWECGGNWLVGIVAAFACCQLQNDYLWGLKHIDWLLQDFEVLQAHLRLSTTTTSIYSTYFQNRTCYPKASVLLLTFPRVALRVGDRVEVGGGNGKDRIGCLRRSPPQVPGIEFLWNIPWKKLVWCEDGKADSAPRFHLCIPPRALACLPHKTPNTTKNTTSQ